MTTYVLDASAGADLLLDTQVGRTILSRLQPGSQWWVPEHYFVKVASVVRRAELTGMITTTKRSPRFAHSRPLHSIVSKFGRCWVMRGRGEDISRSTTLCTWSSQSTFGRPSSPPTYASRGRRC